MVVDAKEDEESPAQNELVFQSQPASPGLHRAQQMSMPKISRARSAILIDSSSLEESRMDVASILDDICLDETTKRQRLEEEEQDLEEENETDEAGNERPEAEDGEIDNDMDYDRVSVVQISEASSSSASPNESRRQSLSSWRDFDGGDDDDHSAFNAAMFVTDSTLVSSEEANNVNDSSDNEREPVRTYDDELDEKICSKDMPINRTVNQQVYDKRTIYTIHSPLYAYLFQFDKQLIM